MKVKMSDVRAVVEGLGLDGRPVCVHASLSSFGRVDGGADTIVDGLLEAGCTMLVPSFTSRNLVGPPPGMRPERNGWSYRAPQPDSGAGRVYTPDTTDIDHGLGAVPAAVVRRPGRHRGSSPIGSFAAIGPMAEELIAGQTPEDIYAPLRALGEHDGAVILMGVGLTRLTLLHLAEERAGRVIFRRWANGPDGQPMMCTYGGCSSGFDKLEPHLAPLERRTKVGRSQWRIYPAGETVEVAAEMIRRQPMITHCGYRCERCDDAVAGGPILTTA